MVSSFFIMLAGLVVFIVGAMLALTGPNGHPAGIPTIYVGLAVIVFGLVRLMAFAFSYFC